MTIRNKRFDRQRIHLDGEPFVGCVFDHCIFVYSGAPLSFHDCEIIQPDFEFNEAAANTVGLLEIVGALHPGKFKMLCSAGMTSRRRGRQRSS